MLVSQIEGPQLSATLLHVGPRKPNMVITFGMRPEANGRCESECYDKYATVFLNDLTIVW